MTLHLFVTLLILLLLLLIQKRMLKDPGDTGLASSLNILVIYLLLPLSFPGMTVIADFFFEGLTDNLVWYSLIFIPLWTISLYWATRNIPLQKGRGWVRKVWLTGMNILLLMGYICGIFTSHHEHGPTPTVMGSVYLMSYFTGVHITIVFSLIMQSWLLMKSKHNTYGIWVKVLFTGGAVVIYLVTLFDTITRTGF
ncbi:hypothetical protein FHW36_105432 [Chitinophaga polysaccharea]|uniref:Uncharacterized protein n=1 Tax=Chitinophaga polysaccharea TaxID=1293035 RepID=A0A561PPF3_9BACT|nr:hypothetical protein [Chitinophaga polysaccharea]TWF39991.1 hypothetical protein FHW36_105432 [Chitinophaga polysaccharea]